MLFTHLGKRPPFTIPRPTQLCWILNKETSQKAQRRELTSSSFFPATPLHLGGRMEYGNARSCPRINTGFFPPFNTLLGKQCICQSWWKYQGHDAQSAALITGQGHLAGHILSSFLPGGSGIPKAISRKLVRGSLVIPTGRTLIFQMTTLRAGNLSNLPQTQDNRPMLSAWGVSGPAGIHLRGDVRYRSMGSHRMGGMVGL